MTNIEFLVNELRKANETIDALRKMNTYLKKRNNELVENKKTSQYIPSLTYLEVLEELKKNLNK